MFLFSHTQTLSLSCLHFHGGTTSSTSQLGRVYPNYKFTLERRFGEGGVERVRWGWAAISALYVSCTLSQNRVAQRLAYVR